MAAQATIPVNEPLLDGNEGRYLAECIRTGWISSEGPFVERLEEGFAARAGRRHGIAVCNGSVALDVAIAAVGLGPGDEVILPSFTIISCAAAVVRGGCDSGACRLRARYLEHDCRTNRRRDHIADKGNNGRSYLWVAR
jgi:dTDP-4-amino-4,6-dideoxygalactose transaminase